MNKLAPLLLLALAGCDAAERVEDTGNKNYHVMLLFEHDGCRVYKFSDWRSVYFTNCQGGVAWDESCGKNCTRNVTVPTQRVR